MLESIVLYNDCRSSSTVSLDASRLSLSARTFTSAVKLRDEEAPAP